MNTDLVIIHSSSEFGGAEKQLLYFLENCHVKTALILLSPEGCLFDEINNSRLVAVYTLRKSSWTQLPVITYQAYRLITKLNPQTIYSYLPVPNLLCYFLGKITKAKRIAWGWRISSLAEQELTYKDRIVGLMMRFLSSKVDYLIANSRPGLDEAIRAGINCKHNVVIQNGILSSNINSETRLTIRKTYRDLLQVPQSHYLIGIVARLVPWKGHEIFLHAARELRSKRNDIAFVCVGGGSDSFTNYLKNLTKTLDLTNSITWLGPRSDIDQILCSLDIFTLTSTSGEGSSNAIGEAMSIGLPIVATNIGESSQQLSDSGLIIEPNDPHALYLAWNRLLENPAERKRISASSKSRVHELYSIKNMVHQTELLLVDGTKDQLCPDETKT